MGPVESNSDPLGKGAGPDFQRVGVYLGTRKREHSRKPDEIFPIIEGCSPGPRLELFARGSRPGWTCWGEQAENYAPSWPTYAHSSAADPRLPLGD